MSEDIEGLWRSYLDTLPPDSPTRDKGYIAEGFGDSVEMAEDLGGLISSGKKTATCSALWEYEAENEPLPEVGQMTVILNGNGEPLCIIETTEVTRRRFDEVDEEFVYEEGEGDRTLAYWREEHERFFSRILPNIGREFSPRMPLVCERFRVVYGGCEESCEISPFQTDRPDGGEGGGDRQQADQGDGVCVADTRMDMGEGGYIEDRVADDLDLPCEFEDQEESQRTGSTRRQTATTSPPRATRRVRRGWSRRSSRASPS